MMRNGGGSIINVSSEYSLTGHTSNTAYACSKAAVNTLTKYIATQYGEFGIRCNTIIAGLIMTNGSSRMPEQIAAAYQKNCLIDEPGQPIDIARMANFLASDESRYITGQEFVVDGGFGAHIPTAISDTERNLWREKG